MILSLGSAPGISAAFVAALVLTSGLALLAYVVAGALSRAGDARPQTGRLAGVLLAGWLLHALAIAVDTSGVGNADAGARFGFAPALSVTVWLVIAVYLLESRWLPLYSVRRTLALLGAAAVLLALAFPGESLPRVLSRWAPLHWVLGIASYGLFGAAVLHAAMMGRAERRLRLLRPGGAATALPAGGDATGGTPAGLPLLQLERLTFRFVTAGFVALTAAIVLGWWVANPWRWDHKSVFSVLGWLVFAGLLAGRRRFGWRGQQATRWLYVGAGLLLLAYVGSRFVFEVLLHRPLGG